LRRDLHLRQLGALALDVDRDVEIALLPLEGATVGAGLIRGLGDLDALLREDLLRPRRDVVDRGVDRRADAVLRELVAGAARAGRRRHAAADEDEEQERVESPHGAEGRPALGHGKPYSSRRAIIGSTRAARRAGRKLATSVSAAMSPTASAIVSGSSGARP